MDPAEHTSPDAIEHGTDPDRPPGEDMRPTAPRDAAVSVAVVALGAPPVDKRVVARAAKDEARAAKDHARAAKKAEHAAKKAAEASKKKADEEAKAQDYVGPLCQRRLRQSFFDICVPSGGEWSRTRAQANLCF